MSNQKPPRLSKMPGMVVAEDWSQFGDALADYVENLERRVAALGGVEE